MITKLDKVASKYAQAYTNLYLDEITNVECQSLLKMVEFLDQNKNFYAYLSIPHLQLDKKLNFINKFAEFFRLTRNQQKLVQVLLVNKKIEILSLVIQKIITIFNQHRNIVTLQVHTSHEVDEQHKQLILKFIKKKLKINAIVDFSINPKLICGIKIKGPAFIWEKSISQYLNFIKKKDISQVEL